MLYAGPNLGSVEWQGKMDIDKAVAPWQKLLDPNPNYEGKDKVLELMAQAKNTRELNRGRRQSRCPNRRNHEQSKTGLPGKKSGGLQSRASFAQPAARPALRLLFWPVGSSPNVLSGPEKFSGALLRKEHAWPGAVHLRVRLSPRLGSAFREPK